MKKFFNMPVILAFILCICLIPINALAYSSDEDSSSVIRITSGSSAIHVNGVPVLSEKPYISGGLLYMPLRTVLEAMGAEVNWLGSGKISVYFRNVSVDLEMGKSTIYVNQEEKLLNAVPVSKNGIVMVPLDMMEKCFSAYIKVASDKDGVSITLNNDGALSDLSFLTGSVTMPRVGNSWFGWSIEIPKGSRIFSQTYNSKYVYLENEHHNIGIEITAVNPNEQTFDEYYAAIVSDPYNELSGELISNSIYKNASIPFMEFLYTDSYDEAVYSRVFDVGTYFIKVTITSYIESDPSLLKDDSIISDIMDSFRSNFKGNSDDTTDLSKVSGGLAEYDNYIYSDTTSKKYFTWKMNVLPDWDVLQNLSNGSYETVLGTGIKENITIEFSSAEEETDAVSYGEKLEEKYLNKFDPELFSLLESGTSKVGDYDAYTMRYDITKGTNKYSYEERIIIYNGLVYDITYKTESDHFEEKRGSFTEMLDTFKPTSNETETIIADWNKYSFNLDKNILDEDTYISSYTNKSWGWSLECPGNWHRNTSFDQSTETFYDSPTGSVVMVEAVQRSTEIFGESDMEKFYSMRIMLNMNLDPVKTYDIHEKGTTIKVYEYRIEDEETENYSNLTFYILQNQKFSYCFMKTIPDLTSTTSNDKLIDEIWNSFTLVEATE